VRRVFLFAALLLLLGLSTAFAASFSTQAEDVASFTTEVSISVPTTQPPGTVRPYYLTGADNLIPGVMTTTPPGGTNVNGKQIDPGTAGTVGADPLLAPTKMHSWQTVIPAGLVLAGNATAYLFRTGGNVPITAGLFRCPAVDTVMSDCFRLGGASDVQGTAEINGEVPISFGSISETILVEQYLRLVVVNQVAEVKPSSPKLNLQWGFKDNRQSRLDLTVVP
jgi:hypothetical protein